MKKAISCFIRISKIKLLCVSPERKTHRRTHKTSFTVGGDRLRKKPKLSDGGESPSSLSTSLLSFKSLFTALAAHYVRRI